MIAFNNFANEAFNLQLFKHLRLAAILVDDFVKFKIFADFTDALILSVLWLRNTNDTFLRVDFELSLLVAIFNFML